MSVKIFRLDFKLLWNREYTMLVDQLVKIMTKYDLGVLHLLKAFGILTGMLPELAKVKAQEAGSEISHQLHELDQERDILFNAIVNQVATMGTAKRASQAPHVAILDHFFDIEGRDIASDTYNGETKRLIDLFKDYDSRPEVQSAAEALNLKIYFDPLREANTQFAEKFLLRTSEEAAIEKVDTRAIRTETDKRLKALFNAIEFCSMEYNTLDYESPANELNTLLAFYKTQIKARATRRANGKDKGEEKPAA